MPPSISFTATFKGIARQIITDIAVSLPFDPKITPLNKRPQNIRCKALWDTGATNCAITRSFAQKLGLTFIDFISVKHAQGITKVNSYDVNVVLTNGIGIPFLRVSEMENSGDNFEFIIGMNVILKGDFAITNDNGNTVLSFRYPSHKSIDFCKEPIGKSFREERDKFLKRGPKSNR